MTDTTGWLIDTTGWLTTPGDWQQHGMTEWHYWVTHNTAGWLSDTTRWLTDTSGWLQELSQERKFHWDVFTWLLMLSHCACSLGTAKSEQWILFVRRIFWPLCWSVWMTPFFFFFRWLCLFMWIILLAWVDDCFSLYMMMLISKSMCLCLEQFWLCRLFVFLSAISGHSNAGM